MTLAKDPSAAARAPFAGRLRARGVDPSLLFRSFDRATAEGRAKERQRRIALTALASGLAKIVSVSTALISAPLTLRYLGAERYGMWMTMGSLVAMLSFADLGVGNGLLASVASANGRGDRGEMRADVSSAFAALLLAALTMLGAIGALYSRIDWAGAFNVETPTAAKEAGPAVAALVVCFSLAMPTGVVQKVQMGLQLGFMTSLWQCLASVTALAGVMAAINRQASLPWLVLAYAGSPLLVAWINGAVFFTRLAPDLAPSWRTISRRAMTTVTRTGALFLVLQMVGALAYASDNLFLAHTSGPLAVAEYAIAAQMFAPITGVLLMVLAPLWPAYGEAIARGDRLWATAILGRSLALSVAVAGLCSLTLVVAGPWLLALWIGRVVSASPMLLAGLGVWKVIEAGGNALAMFLNGAQIVGVQVAISSVMCVAAVALKIVFAKHFGAAGIPWATSLAFAMFAGLPYLVLMKRIVGGRA